MTRRERVVAALRHRRSDLIPWQVDFTRQERDRVAAFLGDEEFERKIGNHIYRAGFGGRGDPENGRPGFFRDEFGVVWNRTGADRDIGAVDRYLLAEPDFGAYRFPDPDEGLVHQSFNDLVIREGDTCRLGRIGMALFERAWTLRGMENLLCDMQLDPSFVEELLDRIVAYNLKIIEIGMSHEGIAGFYFGDDWGQQKPGLIMGPANWRRFLKPRLRTLYAAVKARGGFVVQHSCGDILELYPDLIEIGLDCHNTFQPEIYDIAKVKREFGRDLSFWGGISTQRLLPFASPEGVRRETVRIMRIAGDGGGYIAAPTHAVPQDVPPENIAAMVDVFTHQDSYL